MENIPPRNKTKLSDLLSFFSANNRYISLGFEVKKCSCGATPDHVIFDYRFTDSFQMKWRVFFVCSNCYIHNNKFIKEYDATL
jgi:hypothetical protein